MPRPLQMGPLDEPRDYLGDTGWRGVNMRLDADQLPPGIASKAVNLRFRDGTPETRGGSAVIAWLNKISAGNVQPWGVVYGRGPFRDPSTFTEYELVAADGNVYACLANNAPVLLNLPSGVTVTARCTFLQAFNVVLLLRGFDADPLVMTNLTTGFEVIEETPGGTGTLTIPRCLRGVFMANRVFLLREDDTLVASDAQDYTHYTALNDLRINQGDADRGVALSPYGAASLVVLKEKSVYQIDNVYGDLSGLTLTTVTRRYGCKAAETVVDCGSDLLWLTNEHKVAGLVLTIQNEIQAAQGALQGRFPSLSDPMEPVFNSIAGAHAGTAVAALWNDAYYIAIPVDQAEEPGPELISGGTPAQTIATVAGATYLFTPDVTGEQIINGTETITTARQFVAQGATVDFGGLIFSGDATTSASLKRIYKGVNNVLARYDFVNQAWSGYDEAEGISFKFLFTGTYAGRPRLFVSTHDGYVRLWEEGYADRLSVPYMDVVVDSIPAIGNTIRVNGGTTVTAAAVQSATEWNVSSGLLASVRKQLWLYTDSSYRPESVTPWSAPNTRGQLYPIGESITTLTGVRFYSTNGVVPAITYTGTWATVTYTVEQDIPTEFISRGYSDDELELCEYHGLVLDLDTWHGEFSVNLLADGVNEDVAVAAAVAKDRTAYYFPFDAAPYDPTNVNNDFYTAGREDYSIQPTSASYSFTPGDNIRGDLMQAARETWEVTLAGRSARVQILGTRGRMRLSALRLTDTVDDQMAGPIAS